MRRLLILPLAIASTALLQPASFAQSVTTNPVGFTTKTIAAAPSATTPTLDVVSTPLYTIPAFVGAISSLDSASSFSFTGAAFTANQFTTAPHLVKLRTGNSPGRFFLVSSHDADTLTVNTAGYTLVSGAPASNTQVQVAPGDSAEIFPAHTLNALFPSGGPFFKGGSANVADNVYLFNGSVWEVFFHNNTSWRRSGSGLNQNNTVVYPDDGMFIIRRQTAPLELTFLGAVPTTTERTDLSGPGTTYISNRFPVGTTILATNIHALPGWQTGGSANVTDNVYIWNPATSLFRVYFYNGTNWRRSGFGQNVDNDPIPINGTMFVLRRSSASGTQSTLVQPLPYTL